MVQRIALFVASLAAVVVIVVGLQAAGVGSPAPRPAAVASAASPTDAVPTPRIPVDTVYVAPPQTPRTVVIHKTAPAAIGGYETESEGGGD
jgi:hypothetical protein